MKEYFTNFEALTDKNQHIDLTEMERKEVKGFLYLMTNAQSAGG